MNISQKLNILLFFIGSGLLIYAIATDTAQSLLGAIGFVLVMFTVYRLISRVSQIEDENRSDHLSNTNNDEH